MKPIAIINDTFNNYLYINFLCTTICNYKCSYCYPGCNDGKYRWPTNFELLKQNLGHMLDTYRSKLNKKSIRLGIAGGEPTLWPQLGEFAEHFNKNYDCKLTLATNGSRTLRFWKDYAKYFDDICITAHHASCDVDHIIEVMDYIYENTECVINCKVLMDPEHWDRCVEIVNKLKDHPVPWLLKVRPIMLNNRIAEYTEEQSIYIKDKMKKIPPEDWIKKMKDLKKLNTEEDIQGMQVELEDGSIIKSDTNFILNQGWYFFNGWECHIGVDRFQIDPDGTIVGSCRARNLYGLRSPINLYDENFVEIFNNLNISPVICRQLECTCPTEIKLPKKKHVHSS